MKALIKTEEALAGIGTPMIFIAMVAAVASAVLIRRRDVTNARSTRIAKKTSATISESLYVEAIDEITDGTNLAALNMIEVTRCI